MINNEIYDLAAQAGLITFESIHDSMAVTPNLESVAKAMKFAELLIRECTEVCESITTEGQPLHLVSLGYSQSIKRHFGVKDE